jgi:uncharacterized protein YyaL (SSP411 family)
MPNRLAGESSPYLLQHQNNPVDWYPWGEEAFARAIELDRPIFLSVGYSSCHWCHVMEHESFEDDEVASELNEKFVSIKVDREERPDVDEAFMTAIQMMSSRGGWPMSVFLTPDGRPFYGGTYYAKDDRSGHPGFLTILRQIASAWMSRREDLLAAGQELSDVLSRSLATPAPPAESRFSQLTCDKAVEKLAEDFDPSYGGFGDAPKFPPHTTLEFLTAYAMRDASPEANAQTAFGMSLTTMVRICMGGIRDHVGGGFHRYSTDQRWLLPHFEKMLYDNALMLSNLTRGSIISAEIDPAASAFLKEAADEIILWLVDEMRSPEGAFYSALDADSEGEEGRFYVWKEEEIRGLLGDRAESFISAYGVQPHGNFADEATGERTGGNILHFPAGPTESFHEELEILRRARAERVRPGLDDKCLVGWNGLAIDALALAGQLGPAAIAALAILEAEEIHGRLPRHITKGKPIGDAFLEDYAFFASGLVKLAGLTSLLQAESIDLGGLPPSELWAEQASRLIQTMVSLFYDDENGGFFSVSDRHEVLFGSTKPVFDQPVPSANAIAIRCLFEVGDEERATKSLNALLGWMEKAPQATEALYATALATLEDEADSPEESVTSIPIPAPKSPPRNETVVVKLGNREVVADSSGWGSAEVRISIPEGFHLNSPTPIARWIVPTQLKIRPLESKIEYPPTKEESYEGEIVIPIQIKLPSGSSGEEYEIEVSFQACTDRECLGAQSVRLSGVVVKGP